MRGHACPRHAGLGLRNLEVLLEPLLPAVPQHLLGGRAQHGMLSFRVFRADVDESFFTDEATGTRCLSHLSWKETRQGQRGESEPTVGRGGGSGVLLGWGRAGHILDAFCRWS